MCLLWVVQASALHLYIPGQTQLIWWYGALWISALEATRPCGVYRSNDWRCRGHRSRKWRSRCSKSPDDLLGQQKGDAVSRSFMTSSVWRMIGFPSARQEVLSVDLELVGPVIILIIITAHISDNGDGPVSGFTAEAGFILSSRFQSRTDLVLTVWADSLSADEAVVSHLVSLLILDLSFCSVCVLPLSLLIMRVLDKAGDAPKQHNEISWI